MDDQPRLPMNYGPQVIPIDIAKTLFKALSWSYPKSEKLDQPNEEWEKAWIWVEDNKVYYEEMGG